MAKREQTMRRAKQKRKAEQQVRSAGKARKSEQRRTKKATKAAKNA